MAEILSRERTLAPLIRCCLLLLASILLPPDCFSPTRSAHGDG
jgi:hypothetical protein